METQLNPNIPDDVSASPPTPMVYESEEYYWEYKLVQHDMSNESPLDESRLNELGKEGWELVTVFIQPDNKAHYYFKRPSAETK